VCGIVCVRCHGALVHARTGQSSPMESPSDLEPCTGGGASAAMPYKGPSLYTIWLYTIHGWLMSVAWGALAPAAILIAYKFKDLGPSSLWFQLHRALMVRSS